MIFEKKIKKKNGCWRQTGGDEATHCLGMERLPREFYRRLGSHGLAAQSHCMPLEDCGISHVPLFFFNNILHLLEDLIAPLSNQL